MKVWAVKLPPSAVPYRRLLDLVVERNANRAVKRVVAARGHAHVGAYANPRAVEADPAILEALPLKALARLRDVIRVDLYALPHGSEGLARAVVLANGNCVEVRGWHVRNGGWGERV